MEKHLKFMSLEYKSGRASAAAQLHSLSSALHELRQVKAKIKIAKTMVSPTMSVIHGA